MDRAKFTRTKKKRLIKFAISGGEVSDYDIGKLAIYYKLAKTFGWTVEEIEKLDLVMIANLITFIDEVDKRRAEAGDLSLMGE